MHAEDVHTVERRARRSTLSVAVAQPACTAHDVAANVARHVAAVHAARARVVVFPELSLTGYELDATALSLDDPRIAPLVVACRETGTMALVGAPVAAPGGLEAIAMLAVDGDGVRVAHLKAWPGEAESLRFSGAGRAHVPEVLDVDGWRLGPAVCRDTGVAAHTAALARLDVDVVVAGLVDRPSDLPEQRSRAARIAQTCGAAVAFASAAGPTGGGFEVTAGCSALWAADGSLLAQTGPAPGELARAELS